VECWLALCASVEAQVTATGRAIADGTSSPFPTKASHIAYPNMNIIQKRMNPITHRYYMRMKATAGSVFIDLVL